MPSRSHAQSRNQRGSVLMIALFVLIVLSLLGVALLTLSGTEQNIAYNALWAEGAFAAAEAGIQTGLNQLSASAATSTKKFPKPIAEGSPGDTRNDGTDHVRIGTGTYTYQFRSGPKTATAPQDLTFKGTRVETGYSIAIGTGYNPSGYGFHSYQINTTGKGPKNAQRELEVLAEYGPVAQ